MYSPAPCLSANGVLADVRQAEALNVLMVVGLLFSAFNIMMRRAIPRLPHWPGPQIEHMWSQPEPSSEEPSLAGLQLKAQLHT